MKSSGDGGTLLSPLKQLGQDLKELWRHPVYTITVTGSAVYTGADTGLPAGTISRLITCRAPALRQSNCVPSRHHPLHQQQLSS